MGKRLSLRCIQQVKKKQCKFYKNYKNIDFEDDEDVQETFYKNLNSHQLIEDLSRMPRPPCPFYFSKHQAEEAHLVLMPYNYLFDWEIRDTKKKLFYDAIIIFDEGHNVCQAAESGSKIKFSDVTLSKAINELSKIISKNKKCRESKKQDMNILQNILHSLGGYMSSSKFRANYSFGTGVNFIIIDQILQEAFYDSNGISVEQFYEDEKGYSCSIPVEFEQMKAFRVFLSVLDSVIKFCSHKEYNAIIDISKIKIEPEEEPEIDLIEKFVDKKDPPLELDLEKDPKNVNFKYLKTIHQMFDRIGKIYESTTFNSENYKMFIGWANPFAQNDHASKCEIEITAMTAEETFKEIEQLKPRMVVLTSGTLTPFESVQQEIKFDFPIRFKGKHIIESEDQVPRLTAAPNSLSAESAPDAELELRAPERRRPAHRARRLHRRKRPADPLRNARVLQLVQGDGRCAQLLEE